MQNGVGKVEPVDTASEREAQKSYWKEHSADATVEAMMLDSQAADIDRLERPEVLSILGSVEGLRLLELGAGIGRFTGELARRGASSVHAVDFMENLIAENRAANSHLPGTSFACGDATELAMPPAAFDVVFSNWLLMYLSDAEVSSLACRSLSWLADGGCLFFRESCFRQSGDRARGANPTHYRSPRDYFAIFDAARETERPDGHAARYELVRCKCVDTYVRVKRNQNQVCWKWTKVVYDPSSDSSSAADLRHFLDGGQYSARGIARYAALCGPGFISAGGAPEAAALADALRPLPPAPRLLEVGCGPGGGALRLSEECPGAYVHGVDLSVNAVLEALDAASAAPGHNVSFEISDVRRLSQPVDEFDGALSRDALMHLTRTDKAAVLSRVLSALRPGARLALTDYCAPKGGVPAGGEFETYLRERRYHLLTVEEYAQLLAEVGFVSVSATDRTADFAAALSRELGALREGRAAFEERFSAAEYAEMEGGWEAKLQRAAAGEHCWAQLVAAAPGGGGGGGGAAS